MAQATPSSRAWLDLHQPWWTWPSQLLGFLVPTVRLAAHRDAELVAALAIRQPLLRWLPILPLVIAVLIGRFHQPFYDDVFTESPFIMILAMLIGFAAPTFGVLFVLAFAIFDLTTSIVPLAGWRGVIGHVITYWLLWLLVVEIPVLHRTIAWSALMPGGTWAGARRLIARLPGDQARLALGVATATFMSAVMVYIFTLAAPLLARPVFLWNLKGTTDAAMQVLQNSNQWLIGAAIILALASSVGEAWLMKLRPPTVPAVPTIPRWRSAWLGLVRQGLMAVLLVVALSGMITSPIDTILLLGALFGGPVLAQVVLAVPPIERGLALIPLPVRFLIGFVVTFLLARPIAGLWLNGRITSQVFDSEFLPVVISTAIGVVIFSILLGTRQEILPWRKPSGGTRLRVLVGAAASAGLALWLGLPELALAGDCSGLTDCWGAGQAGTAAAAGAAAAAAAIAGSRAVGGKIADWMNGHGDELGGKAGVIGDTSGQDIEPPAASVAESPPVAETGPAPAPTPAAPAAPLVDDQLGGKAGAIAESGGQVAAAPAAPVTEPAPTLAPAPDAQAPALPVTPATDADGQAIDTGDDAAGGKLRSLGDLPTPDDGGSVHGPAAASQPPTTPQTPASPFIRPTIDATTQDAAPSDSGDAITSEPGPASPATEPATEAPTAADADDAGVGGKAQSLGDLPSSGEATPESGPTTPPTGPANPTGGPVIRPTTDDAQGHPPATGPDPTRRP